MKLLISQTGFPRTTIIEFNINDLKDQLGIDHIMQSSNVLNEKLVGLSGIDSLPKLEILLANQIKLILLILVILFLIQWWLLEPRIQISLTEACFYPWCLRRIAQDRFGSDMADAIAQGVKNADHGIQEVQKNIVKSAQPMVQLFGSVLKAQNEKKMLQPSETLPVIGDAITFLSCASF